MPKKSGCIYINWISSIYICINISTGEKISSFPSSPSFIPFLKWIYYECCSILTCTHRKTNAWLAGKQPWMKMYLLSYLKKKKTWFSIAILVLPWGTVWYWKSTWQGPYVLVYMDHLPKDLEVDWKITTSPRHPKHPGRLPRKAIPVTPRKFNSSPLKNGGWKTTFLLGR